MIKKILGSFLINIFALFVTSQFVSGLKISLQLQQFLIVGVGFTLVHLILKPILDILFRPLNFLTLGIAGFILDAAILYAMTIYFPQISITPWNFTGLVIYGISLPPRFFGIIETTVIASFIINFIRTFLITIFY